MFDLVPKLTKQRIAIVYDILDPNLFHPGYQIAYGTLDPNLLSVYCLSDVFVVKNNEHLINFVVDTSAASVDEKHMLTSALTCKIKLGNKQEKN